MMILAPLQILFLSTRIDPTLLHKMNIYDGIKGALPLYQEIKVYRCIFLRPGTSNYYCMIFCFYYPLVLNI
jgi:hypothetical protein